MYYFERYTLIHVPVTTIFFKTEKKREEREKREKKGKGKGRKKNRQKRRGRGGEGREDSRGQEWRTENKMNDEANVAK